MNKHMIASLAGLALAATFASPAGAQDKAGSPKIKRETVELDRNENNNKNFSNTREFSFDRSGRGQFSVDLDGNRVAKNVFTTAADGREQPLIISSGALDAEAMGNLEEDLTIMSRILDKAVDRDDGDGKPDKAMGIHLWTLGGNRGPRNMYIEGHGAVFVLNVGMPLIGSKSKEPMEEKKESTNSTWESARNELYGGSDGDGKGKTRILKNRLAQNFDPARVEALKKNLTDSLKNAAHIRGLKDNESVTIVVQGAGGNVRRLVTSGQNSVDVFAFTGAEQNGMGPRTVMTLRAKKSDIEAFSKGRLDEDAFAKKIAVSTYQSGAGK